jgi:hypothetical protein
MVTVLINALMTFIPSIWELIALAVGVVIGLYWRGKVDLKPIVDAMRRKPLHRKPLLVKRPKK